MVPHFSPQLHSDTVALFYFMDASVSGLKLRGSPPHFVVPCREAGSKSPAWHRAQTAAKDGPKLTALIATPRRHVSAAFPPLMSVKRDKQGHSKVLR